MKNVLSLLTLLVTFSTNCLAAGPAGTGSDVWTSYLERENLFSPHENFCDTTTEAFVNVLPGNKGFCIEKSRRSSPSSGYISWDDARYTCIQAGKRLPEVAEIKRACQRNSPDSLGISSISSAGWEWASNFQQPIFNPNIPFDGWGSAIFGYNGCESGASAINLLHPTPGATLAYFRCVR